MTQQTTLDPFGVWKSIYEKTEANVNEAIHDVMKQEAFSEWLGQTQSAYLQYQQLVQTTAENYMKQINMPTRDEIANVATLVINLEEKVDALDQKVEDELLTNPSLAEINKLKTSISRLDKKVDQLLKMMQQPPEQPKEMSAPQNKK